jgi:hypothetical protein
MKMQCVLAAGAMASLSACVARESGVSVRLVDAAAFSSDRSGVIIFSTGATGDCTSFATFLKVLDPATMRVVPDVPLVPVDGLFDKSDFTDHKGTVNALVLAPGKYYLEPWTANPYVVAKKKLAFPFEVTAGETTYLGELFMPRSCSLTTSFVLHDRYARDIALAAQKNPSVAQRTAVTRLLGRDMGEEGLVKPAAAPAAPAAPVAAAQAAPQLTESWNGVMACKARKDNGANAGAYEVKFAMEMRDGAVTVSRKTADVSETLTGRADGGRLELRGNGYRLGDASKTWQFGIRGDFLAGATSYTGSGNMVAYGKPVRACELRMARS